MVDHLSGYQNRDREIVDYRMYSLAPTGLWFRGPELPELPRGGYIVCLGAAQTFGCFCEKPFPQLLQEQTGLPVLNLGYGGAGPSFFTKHDSLQPFIQNARLAIVQVMSGRSVSNSLFDSGGLEFLQRRSDGVRLSAEAAYARVLSDARGAINTAASSPLRRIWRRLIRAYRVKFVQRLVRETRQQWIDDNRSLMNWIGVPTVLLWFSRRAPDYAIDYSSVAGLFGEFPQLVNRPMVEAVKPRATRYVECVTSRGSPQLLRSRFTGRPSPVNLADDRPDFGNSLMTHNAYYPTPEMHEDAATALAPVCLAL